MFPTRVLAAVGGAEAVARRRTAGERLAEIGERSGSEDRRIPEGQRDRRTVEIYERRPRVTEGRGVQREPGSEELRLLLGRIAGVLGILLALAGSVAAEVSAEALGIILGLTAYGLGSRWLGMAAVVVSTVMLIVVLAVGQGYIPGIDPTYPRGLF